MNRSSHYSTKLGSIFLPGIILVLLVLLYAGCKETANDAQKGGPTSSNTDGKEEICDTFPMITTGAAKDELISAGIVRKKSFCGNVFEMPSIVPMPKVAKNNQNKIKLDQTWEIATISGKTDDASLAKTLKNDLKGFKTSDGFDVPGLTGWDLALNDSGYSTDEISKKKKIILVETENEAGFLKKYFFDKRISFESYVGCGENRKGFGEEYILHIDAEREMIALYARTSAGLSNAAQTLWWLIGKGERSLSLSANAKIDIPSVTVIDWPDMNIRGMYFPHWIAPYRTEPLYRVKLNALNPYLSPPNFQNSNYFSSYTARLEELVAHNVGLIPIVDAIIEMATPIDYYDGWYVGNEPFIIGANGYATPKGPIEVNATSKWHTDARPGYGVNYAGVKPAGASWNGDTAWASGDTINWAKGVSSWSDVTINGKSAKKLTITPANGTSQLNDQFNEAERIKKETNPAYTQKYKFSKPNILSDRLNIGESFDPASFTFSPGVYLFTVKVRARKDINGDNCGVGFTIVEENSMLTDRWYNRYYGKSITERDVVPENSTETYGESVLALLFMVPERSPHLSVETTSIPMWLDESMECSSAEFTFSDFKFTRLDGALRDVILTESSSLKVTDISGAEYNENVDYILEGKAPPLPTDIAKYANVLDQSGGHRALKIKWIGNRRPQNNEILVSYNFLAFDLTDSTPRLSYGERGLLDKFDREVVQKLFEHQTWRKAITHVELNFDEMLGFNGDSRSWTLFGAQERLPNWKFFDLLKKRYIQMVDNAALSSGWKGRSGESVPKILSMEMLAMYGNGANNCYLGTKHSYQNNCGQTGAGFAGFDKSREIGSVWGMFATSDAVSIHKNMKIPFAYQTGTSPEEILWWEQNFEHYGYYPVGILGTPYHTDPLIVLPETGIDYKRVSSAMGTTTPEALGAVCPELKNFTPSKDFPSWFDFGNDKPRAIFKNLLTYYPGVYEALLSELGNISEAGWNRLSGRLSHDEIINRPMYQEICNNKDDDGDGAVDEEIYLERDIHNCGSCGNSCYKKVGENVRCENGVCKCQPDGIGPFGDCDR